MPSAGTIGAALARLRSRIAACDRYDLAGVALLAALVVLAFATFDSYAISNDEEVQQHYGEMIISYYASGFSDQQLFHYVNLYLYGGLFDILAVLIERALPMFDPYTVRHLLCALTGIAGIGAAWATARLVAGPRAGAIAAFALATCGPWYGSMFNHTKDIPFAAAMMGAVYFLCRVARELPQPRRRDTICFGLLLGAALGIRVLGLLLIGYVAVAVFMRMRAGSMHDRLRSVRQSSAPARLKTTMNRMRHVNARPVQCLRAKKLCARRRGRRALDPAARGDDRGARIARPMRGVGRLRLKMCALTPSGAPADRSADGGSQARRRRRGSGGARCARSRSSAVGSCQNGSEKASRRSARVMPISASMRRSRLASAVASFQWRRLCASFLSQLVTRTSRDAKARSKVPPAMGKTGIFALMSVFLRFAVAGLNSP